MTIAVGDRLPDVTFQSLTADGPVKRTTRDIFAGRTVVLFGVPGAFTPTCHRNHLPGFIEQRDAILAAGVDEVAVVATNDVWVMDAWANATGAKDRILFLSDDEGAFARATGLEIDRSGTGVGLRLQRFSMIVEDGVVKDLNVEGTPKEATVSGAARILERLGERAAA
jgi:glutaredoxin/glutathione-dependent peroxiredoxin